MKHKFAVGDRVKLVGLFQYTKCYQQGLVIGNTATVVGVESKDDVRIITDGADSNNNGEHMVNGGGTRGWPFRPHCLELIKPAAKPINFQCLALRMSKAKTIKEAREIYAKATAK